MNRPHYASPSNVSSELGHEWLRGTQQIAAGREARPDAQVVLGESEAIPGEAGVSSQPMAEASREKASRLRPKGLNQLQITSIAIPDVTPQPAHQVREQDQDGLKAFAMSLAEASDDRLSQLAHPFSVSAKSMPTLTGLELVTPHEASAEGVEPTDGWVLTPTRPGGDREPKTTNDSPQTKPTKDQPPSPESVRPAECQALGRPTNAMPSQSVSPPSADEIGFNGDDVLDQTLGVTLEQSKRLSGVVESVLERAVGRESIVVVFLGSQENPHVDETTSAVVSMLAAKRLGSVLLVDSNVNSKALTRSSGRAQAEGLGEVLCEARGWKPMIVRGAASGVDFLPAGQKKLLGARLNQQSSQLMNELKANYRFICISAGDVERSPGRLWSEIADGCYLLVSQKHANPTLAQSAVAELRSCGARILGCVVTDSES